MNAREAAAIVAKVQRESKAGMLGSRDLAKNEAASAALALKGEDRLALAMAFFDAYGEYTDTLRKKTGGWAGGEWMNLHERHLWLMMGARLLQKNDRLGVAEWERVFAAMARFERLSTFDHQSLPTLITVAEKSLPGIGPIPDSLRANISAVVAAINADGRAAEVRLAHRLEVLLLEPGASEEADGSSISAMERVLLERDRLDTEMGEPLWRLVLAVMTSPAEGDEVTPARFDGAALPEHRAGVDWLNALFADAPSSGRADPYALKAVDGASPRFGRDLSLSFVMAALASVSQRQIRYAYQSRRYERFHAAAISLVYVMGGGLGASGFTDEEDLVQFCLAFGSTRDFEFYRCPTREAVARVAEAGAPLMERAGSVRLACALAHFRERVARTQHAASDLEAFDRAMRVGVGFPVDLGERWSDAIRRDTLAMRQPARKQWEKFLTHCAAATGSKPSAKWLTAAGECVRAIGPSEVEVRFAAWLPLVGKPRPVLPGGTVSGRDSSVPGERGADMLRGMAWAASHVDTARMASTLGDLAMACSSR